MANFSLKQLLSTVKQAKSNLTNLSLHAKYLHNIPVKEIKIPTHWGFIQGKLWGDEQQRPILAVHGWQDNAGTWDTLIPLLPKDCSFLAIDFPGHGQSSWYPRGMHYYFWDWIRAIYTIKNYFQWEKLSLLGHSLGGITSTRFAGLYPDAVDMLIVLENMMPELTRIQDKDKIAQIIEKTSMNLQKIESAQNLLDKEPPSYSYEETIQRWHLGTDKSVSLESACYLVNRGTRPSKNDPKKFYFSRDLRLKSMLFIPEDDNYLRVLVHKIKCPMLYIKATDSNYATDDFSVEMREYMSKIHSKYEMQLIPGTHHAHLNTPELVAPIITQFLDKHHFFQLKCESRRVKTSSL